MEKLPYFEEPRIQELSYESNDPHKTVDPLFLWMPVGRQVYLWFGLNPITGKDDIQVFGKDHTRLNRTLNTSYPMHVFFGSIFAAIEIGSIYVITDVIRFRGIDISMSVEQCWKWTLVVQDIVSYSSGKIWIPFMKTQISNPLEDCGYKLHHIQERSWTKLKPYYRICFKDTQLKGNKKIENITEETIHRYKTPRLEMAIKPFVSVWNNRKPQYKKSATVFWIMADETYDLYKLYAKDAKGEPVFVDYACIIDKETSKWLNGLFRIIPENGSLDLIEESDDEEDFESEKNITNLEKRCSIHCKYNFRMRKWVPIISEANQLETISIYEL
jgi:hypothetical protein